MVKAAADVNKKEVVCTGKHVVSWQSRATCNLPFPGASETGPESPYIMSKGLEEGSVRLLEGARPVFTSWVLRRPYRAVVPKLFQAATGL